MGGSRRNRTGRQGGAGTSGGIEFQARLGAGIATSILLGLGVCSRFDEDIQWAFGAWVQLRHHEFTERVNPEEPVTVGVLLTPCVKKRKRQWDTTMTAVRGRIELSEEELTAYVELWKREQDLAA